MTFLIKHKKEIIKLILAIAPILGLSGLAYEQNQELQELRTTVVIEQEPVEVNITQPVRLQEHDHKHTHPEFKQIREIIKEWH